LSDIPSGPATTPPKGGLSWDTSVFKPKFIFLFGVHCGQYYDEVEVLKTRPKGRERIGDPIHEGDRLYIQSGMTIVVPAWRITELMNLEVLEMVRKQREERLGAAARRRAQPESVAVPTSDKPSDGNPNHREDFTSLLNGAVKKHAQEKACTRRLNIAVCECRMFRR